MKTLDEIINNENYTRLNGLLVKRSIELAEKIRQAMRSAEIDEIGDYSIRTVKSNAGYSITSLYIIADTDAGRDAGYRNLEQDTSGYFCNDFAAWIEAAKGRDRIKFLNNARSILDEIDAIKQDRITKMLDTLEAAEKL